MSRKIRSIAILTLVVIFFAACTGKTDPVLRRYAEFEGGRDQWDAIRTVTSTGEYDYGGIKFPFTTFSSAPDHYKMIVPFDGKFYAQAYDGKRGWKIDAFKNETRATMLDGADALNLANEADVSMKPLLLGTSFTYGFEGQATDTTLNGKPCSRLILIFSNGTPERYYFDRVTGELILKKARSKNSELGKAWLNTTYSDYRDVDGVKFPFHIEHETNGQKVLIISINKIVVNAPIDEKEFQP